MKNKLDDIDILPFLDELLHDDKFHNEQWEGMRFKKIRDIQIDNRGEVGELLVAKCLRQLGKEVEHNSSTDPENKGWDVRVIDDDLKLEVKTASLGKANTFQHESIERDRDYHGVVFVDVAPVEIYITFLTKQEIMKRKPHKRRYGIHYKVDWGLKFAKQNLVESLADFAQSYEAFQNKVKEFDVSSTNL